MALGQVAPRRRLASAAARRTRERFIRASLFCGDGLQVIEGSECTARAIEQEELAEQSRSGAGRGNFAQCEGFKAESLVVLAAAPTAVFERVTALSVALHGIVELTALVHACCVSLRAGIEAGISLADLC
jgi:hypothetical protein